VESGETDSSNSRDGIGASSQKDALPVLSDNSNDGPSDNPDSNQSAGK